MRSLHMNWLTVQFQITNLELTINSHPSAQMVRESCLHGHATLVTMKAYEIFPAKNLDATQLKGILLYKLL